MLVDVVVKSIITVRACACKIIVPTIRKNEIMAEWFPSKSQGIGRKKKTTDVSLSFHFIYFTNSFDLIFFHFH